MKEVKKTHFFLQRRVMTAICEVFLKINAKSLFLRGDLLFTVNKHLLQPNYLVTMLRLL